MSGKNSVFQFLTPVFALLLAALVFKNDAHDCPLNSNSYPPPLPQALMSTPELIQFHGYPMESHFVTTEDGYILNMFRIPHGKGQASSTRGPVLFLHGMIMSSDTWLLAPEGSILAFMLAEQGYDVWLGNDRGVQVSQRHVSLSVNSTDFWNFTFHEMGIYDLPAMMNFILALTNTEQLDVVGHSMGCTVFFIGMDRLPHLQRHVRRMIAMAPVAYLHHAKTPWRILEVVPTQISTEFADIFTEGRLLFPKLTGFLLRYAPYVCAADYAVCFCLDNVFFMTGYDYSQVDKLTAGLILGHMPAETSAKGLAHYFQWGKNEVFREYDYGLIGNVARYGNILPPKYFLSTNKVETFVLNGPNDWLVTPTDTNRVVRELGNVSRHLVIPYSQFAHLDFIFGKFVKSLVYDDIVDFLIA